MNAAIVDTFERAPRYGYISAPEQTDGSVLVLPKAAALSNYRKSRAAGRHYTNTPELPFIPGDDGVGRLKDGRRVYFSLFGQRFGSMAEIVAVPHDLCIPLPEKVDETTAAAMANPGMASWLALTTRAKFRHGESVLVNGATGISGQLAIQIARFLGAGKIVATGRDPNVLKTMQSMGADSVISLDVQEEELVELLRDEIRLNHVAIVLDFLWGIPAGRIISAISSRGSHAGEPRIRFVQIGTMAGGELSINGSALRSSGVELLGSGLGSASAAQVKRATADFLSAIVPGQFTVPIQVSPLSRVESDWNRPLNHSRLVFSI